MIADHPANCMTEQEQYDNLEALSPRDENKALENSVEEKEECQYTTSGPCSGEIEEKKSSTCGLKCSTKAPKVTPSEATKAFYEYVHPNCVENEDHLGSEPCAIREYIFVLRHSLSNPSMIPPGIRQMYPEGPAEIEKLKAFLREVHGGDSIEYLESHINECGLACQKRLDDYMYRGQANIANWPQRIVIELQAWNKAWAGRNVFIDRNGIKRHMKYKAQMESGSTTPLCSPPPMDAPWKVDDGEDVFEVRSRGFSSEKSSCGPSLAQTVTSTIKSLNIPSTLQSLPSKMQSLHSQLRSIPVPPTLKEHATRALSSLEPTATALKSRRNALMPGSLTIPTSELIQRIPSLTDKQRIQLEEVCTDSCMKQAMAVGVAAVGLLYYCW